MVPGATPWWGTSRADALNRCSRWGEAQGAGDGTLGVEAEGGCQARRTLDLSTIGDSWHRVTDGCIGQDSKQLL
jgi:hypothetical protein